MEVNMLQASTCHLDIPEGFYSSYYAKYSEGYVYTMFCKFEIR
jgi:hypothetical protein